MSIEFPFERTRLRFAIVLKIERELVQRFQAGEVIRGENLALRDGKIDSNLIQPTGEDGRVHED